MKKIIFLLFICQFYSCNKIDIFDNNTEQIKKTVNIKQFNKLIIKDLFTVELVKDNKNFIVFKAYKNQINKIKITEENNNLYLTHKNYRWTQKNNNIIAEVHFSSIEKISMEAPCTLNIKECLKQQTLEIDAKESCEIAEGDLNLDLEKFRFHSYGNIFGKIQIKGKCVNSTIILNGAINIDASKLETLKANIIQNSIGEARVWATEHLDVSTYCSGNIYYKGNINPNMSRHQINNQTPNSKLINTSN